MRPLRRTRHDNTTVDPKTGKECPSESFYQDDLLSDKGSVDTLSNHRDYIQHCGCPGPVGGCCHDCGEFSCVKCHGRCGSCMKPLCLECSVFVDVAGGGKVRLCRRCHLRIVRRERLAKVTRLLLSPFIRFE